MSNIVPLKKEPERLIWHCIECNCASFLLYNDKTVECAGCHNPGVDDGEWIINLPVPDRETITKDDDNAINVIAWGSPEMALRSVLKKIAAINEDGDMAMVAGWSHSGAMQSWFDIATEEQKQWALRKLAELTEHVAKVDTTGN